MAAFYHHSGCHDSEDDCARGGAGAGIFIGKSVRAARQRAIIAGAGGVAGMIGETG
jgi:hypothetical protein